MEGRRLNDQKLSGKTLLGSFLAGTANDRDAAIGVGEVELALVEIATQACARTGQALSRQRDNKPTPVALNRHVRDHTDPMAQELRYARWCLLGH